MSDGFCKSHEALAVQIADLKERVDKSDERHERHDEVISDIKEALVGIKQTNETLKEILLNLVTSKGNPVIDKLLKILEWVVVAAVGALIYSATGKAPAGAENTGMILENMRRFFV